MKPKEYLSRCDYRYLANIIPSRRAYGTTLPKKPLALLERIINASSNPGDVVLDPFCGCGTAVEAAQKLDRQWIGIDITSLAISLIEKRLRDSFPGIQFEVIGTPKDLEGARDLALRDKYQFQWWACSLVNAQPTRAKRKAPIPASTADLLQDGSTPPRRSSSQSKVVKVSASPRSAISKAQSTVRKRPSVYTSPLPNPPAPCRPKPSALAITIRLWAPATPKFRS